MIAVASSGADGADDSPGAAYRNALEALTAEFGPEHPLKWHGEGGEEAKTTEAIFSTASNGTVVVQSDGTRCRAWIWKAE